MTNFNAQEKQRYQRHFSLNEVGVEGQKKLKAAKVLIVGAGGLGSPAALYLAAAGVGTIGLIDDDNVDFSNLQRQILYTEIDVGQPKATKAAERLSAMNSHINLVAHNVKLTAANALEILADYDIILSATDNFNARYLTNDACVKLGKPNIHASISQFEGHLSVFTGQPCYRCLHPNAPTDHVQNCAEAGVMGTLPGILGTMQANEAIKLILNIGKSAEGRLIVFDSLNLSMKEFTLEADPNCQACAEGATIELKNEQQEANIMSNPEMTVQQLKERQQKDDNYLFLDVREPHEIEFCNIGGTFIPLGDVAARLAEFSDWKSKEVIVFCRSGGRSATAQKILLQEGFEDVTNVKGGILAWAKEIDNSVPTY